VEGEHFVKEDLTFTK